MYWKDQAEARNGLKTVVAAGISCLGFDWQLFEIMSSVNRLLMETFVDPSIDRRTELLLNPEELHNGTVKSMQI
jgi:hypothetical protein